MNTRNEKWCFSFLSEFFHVPWTILWNQMNDHFFWLLFRSLFFFAVVQSMCLTCDGGAKGVNDEKKSNESKTQNISGYFFFFFFFAFRLFSFFIYISILFIHRNWNGYFVVLFICFVFSEFTFRYIKKNISNHHNNNNPITITIIITVVENQL